MIIDETMVADVARLASARPVDELLREELMQAYPGIRFTLCSEDDIHAGKPVLAADGFAIFLVGSGDHCLTLTNDFSLATGIVIAQTYED